MTDKTTLRARAQPDLEAFREETAQALTDAGWYASASLVRDGRTPTETALIKMRLQADALAHVEVLAEALGVKP